MRTKIMVHNVVLLLFAGGLITLYEATARTRVLFGLSADGIRNLILSFALVIALAGLTITTRGRLPSPAPAWPYMLLVAWALASTSWTTHFLHSIREGARLLYPIGIFMLARTVTRSEDGAKALAYGVRRILTLFVLVTLAVSFAEIAILFRAGNWTWGGTRIRDLPLAISQPLVASFILMELAFSGTDERWKPRWMLMMLAVAHVFLSITRAYVLGLVLAVGGALFVSKRRSTYRLGVVSLTIMLFVLGLTLDNPIKDRMFIKPSEVSVSSLVHLVGTNPGRLASGEFLRLSGRDSYWRFLLTRAFEERSPIMGAGIGSSWSIMRTSPWGDINAHGDFARILAELGVVGLALTIVMYIGLLTKLARTISVHTSGSMKRGAAILIFGQGVFALVAGVTYDITLLVFDFVALMAVAGAIAFPTGQSNLARKRTFTRSALPANIR